MVTQPPTDPHEKAKRLARLIVADIILYNTEKIAEGIKSDSLFALLDKDITEGRKYYDRQVDPFPGARGAVHVEARVKDLGLLVEDVRAKYEALSGEREVLDRANARINELRSVLHEAERRIERS